MAKYKVTFSGFVLVEADSAEEAVGMAIDDAPEVLLTDTEYGDAEEIDSFEEYGVCDDD